MIQPRCNKPFINQSNGCWEIHVTVHGAKYVLIYNVHKHMQTAGMQEQSMKH